MFKLGDHVSGHDKQGAAICGIVFSCTHAHPFEAVVLVPEVDFLLPVNSGFMYILNHPVYGMLSVRFRQAHAHGADLTLHS